MVQNEGMDTLPHSITAFTEEQHSNESAMVALPAIASLPKLILLEPLARDSLPSATPFSTEKG